MDLPQVSMAYSWNIDLKYYNVCAKCLKKTDKFHMNISLLGYIGNNIHIDEVFDHHDR